MNEPNKNIVLDIINQIEKIDNIDDILAIHAGISTILNNRLNLKNEDSNETH